MTNVIHSELRFALRRSRVANADLLRYAERLCEDMKLRLTPGRRRVLKALIACNRPVGICELLEHLGREGGSVSAASVSHPLAFLVRLGIVRHLAAQNTYVLVRNHNADEAVPILLICTECGSVRERSYPAFDQSLQAERFHSHGPVELEGICDCCSFMASESEAT